MKPKDRKRLLVVLALMESWDGFDGTPEQEFARQQLRLVLGFDQRTLSGRGIRLRRLCAKVHALSDAAMVRHLRKELQ